MLVLLRKRTLATLLVTIALLGISTAILAASVCPHNDSCCIERELAPAGTLFGRVEGGAHGSTGRKIDSKANHCGDQRTASPSKQVNVFSETDDSCARCLSDFNPNGTFSSAFSVNSGSLNNLEIFLLPVWQPSVPSRAAASPSDHSPPGGLVSTRHILNNSFRI
jgi:hypothetical protein